MTLDRRSFILGTTTLTLLGHPFFSIRAQGLKKRNLIVIMLRGAMDGLTAVPPRDSLMKRARPDILVTDVKKLTSDFDLHPKLEFFHELWKRNQASVVHATNIPYTGRSHFEGQNLMESGGHVPYKERTGWLGRGIDAAEMNGLAVSLPMPLLLRGAEMQDNYYPTYYGLPNKGIVQRVASTFEDGSKLSEIMKQIIDRPQTMMRARGERDANSLAKVAARQMKAEDGPRVAVFDIGGFDTHAAQGGTDGEHGEKLNKVDDLMKTLATELGSEFDNTLILTLTEFGRKVEQNGGYGTEHGYGTALLMAGGLLKKSQIYADWPGLTKKHRFEGQDLNATMDARAVYCAAMAACFDVEFEHLRKKVFWGDPLPDVTQDLFKV